MSGQEEQENNAWQLERSLETYDEEYQVERILDKKIGADGTVYYLIKWQGYEDEDTWEPERNLDQCPELINDFESRVSAEADKGTEVERVLPILQRDNNKSPPPVKIEVPEEEERDPVSNGTENERPSSRSSTHSHETFTPHPVGFDRGLEPQQILGVLDRDGEMHFLMKWKDSDVTDIVTRLDANSKCPQIVIKFYEEKITWRTRTLAEILGEDEEADKIEDPILD